MFPGLSLFLERKAAEGQADLAMQEYGLLDRENVLRTHACSCSELHDY